MTTVWIVWDSLSEGHVAVCTTAEKANEIADMHNKRVGNDRYTEVWPVTLDKYPLD